MIETLIVEDDHHVARIHAAYVHRVSGFRVVAQAATLQAATIEIQRHHPQLVLLDLYLPDGHGLALLQRFAASRSRPDFLVISAARDMATVRAAMQHGTVHFLVKPFAFAQLEERLLAYRNLQSRLDRLDEAGQEDVDALYGLLRGPAPPPKGVSAPTLSLIRDLLAQADDDVTASGVAAAIGISRSTAQRYLASLVRGGEAQLRLHYGETGRPEHRYRAGDGQRP